MNEEAMSMKPVPRAGYFGAERTVIIGGLLIAVVLGLGGGAFQPGAVQTSLFALSSLGWVTATMLLTVRYVRQGDTTVAAGMAILTFAEMLLWGQPNDPGNAPAFTGAVMFYLPGLLLISLPKVLPWLVRLMGVLASLPWAVFSFQLLTSRTQPGANAISLLGYVLVSATMIAWVLVLVRAQPHA